MGVPRAMRAVGLAAALGWAAACSAASPVLHPIDIRGLSFRPARVEVGAGDTVSWINHDIVPHTVTAVDGSWDSGEIPPGGTFTMTADTAGTVEYVCRYHPTMSGRLSRR